MKKIKLFLLLLSCFALLTGFTPIPIHANQTLIITEKNIHELDEFVIVKDNHFVLELPRSIVINTELRNSIELSIKNKRFYN